MKRLPIAAIAVLIGLAIAISACGSAASPGNGGAAPSELIIPVNIAESLKRPEAEAVAYFQANREDIETLGEYLLASEAVFRTRPVILHRDYEVDKIQDPAVRAFAERLFDEGVVQSIQSLNDNPSKQVDYLIDDLHGAYRQGIAYLSLPEMLEEDSSLLSFVKTFKDLGGGWYYYVYHYHDVKDEDRYRDLAWNLLSDEARDTVTEPKEKAVVVLEAGTNVGHWIDDDRKRKPEYVVSVTFNTELDGLLGPITLYFDPAGMELVGAAPRY